ncbi:TPA: hypothetical protein KQG29_003887 [Clostridioides difficile]|nr:hypothetical protein [Clostridioides difficile]
MKTRNEIIKDLEDRLFLLKFTRFEGPELEECWGCIAGLESCIKKHKEGWTIEQFKKHLEEYTKKDEYGEYVDGFIGTLKRNIRDMERDGIGN